MLLAKPDSVACQITMLTELGRPFWKLCSAPNGRPGAEQVFHVRRPAGSGRGRGVSPFGAMRVESSLEMAAQPLKREVCAAPPAAAPQSATTATSAAASALHCASPLPMRRQLLLRPQVELLALLARHDLVLGHALLRIGRGQALHHARDRVLRGRCCMSSSRCGKVRFLPSGAVIQAPRSRLASPSVDGAVTLRAVLLQDVGDAAGRAVLASLASGAWS